MAVLLELISPPRAETAMHAGHRCVVLCRGRKPFFWAARLRRRWQFWPAPGAHRCPMCGKQAVGWPAPIAPERYARELRQLVEDDQPVRITSRRGLRARPAEPNQGEITDD